MHNTPLHLASKFGHVAIVLSLTSNKRIQLDSFNNKNLAALDVVKEHTWTTFQPQRYVFNVNYNSVIHLSKFCTNY